MDKRPASPVTGFKSVKWIRSIPTKQIADQYKQGLEIDISEYFRNFSTIDVFQCLETGYQFYYPFDIAGDNHFYQLFQKNE